MNVRIRNVIVGFGLGIALIVVGGMINNVKKRSAFDKAYTLIQPGCSAEEVYGIFVRYGFKEIDRESGHISGVVTLTLGGSFKMNVKLDTSGTVSAKEAFDSGILWETF